MARLATVSGAVGALILLVVPVVLAAPAAGEAADRQAAERLLDRVIAEQRARQARERAEADRLVTAAVQLYRNGDYAAARETLERALRLDAANAGGLELKAALDQKLAGPKPALAVADRTAEPGEIERQLRVALVEGRRLMTDGQYLAAVEVLENAERAIALAPGGVNLTPYKAETAVSLAQARTAEKWAANPPQAEAEAAEVPGPTVPTPFNPDGTRRKGELGPVPSPVDPQQDRRVIFREDARFWAKPSTYHEEYDFAAAELAVRPIGPTPLLRLPADWKEKSERRLAETRGWPKWEQELRAQLAKPLDSKVDFKGVTLTQALAFLRDLSGVNMVVDPAVSQAGLDKSKITFEVDRIKLESALNLVAEMTGTEYLLRDEVVLFTTPAKAKSFTVARLYHIGDLTQPMINWVEWFPLRPPQPWQADPWWERYLDLYEQWGYDGYPPPFWPNKYMPGQSREERTERLLDAISRVLGRPEGGD